MRYVVASTPRCGSNFLQRGLWRTARAGAPEEYLTPPYVEDFRHRFPSETLGLGSPAAVDRYVSLLWTIRTSPNGVFGVKLHGSHYQYVTAGGTLVDTIAGSHWIVLRRRDDVLQAVSYLIADQTNEWIVDGKWLPLAESKGDPQYDRAGIADRLDQIRRENRLWSFVTEPLGDLVLELVYEDLIGAYDEVMTRVFQFLGIPDAPLEFPDPAITRQAKDLNYEWAERFRSETDQH